MSATVTFTVADRARRPEPGIRAVIHDAELPMAWWRAVPVRRWVEQSLSGLELFVLEAAVTMGGIDPTELSAITGLPGALLPALARRLVSTGVLVATGGGYAVHPERGRTALAAGHLRVEATGRTDLVFLLETDELVAIDTHAANDPLSKLDNRRLDPAYQVPVPADLAAAPRGGFLARRLRERRIPGLSDRVFDFVVPNQDEPLLRNGFCPVYRCDAIVREVKNSKVIELTIHGRSVRRRRGDESPNRKVHLHLAGADRLAATWAGAGALLSDPSTRADAWAAAIEAGGAKTAPPATSTGPLTWQVHLSAESIEPLVATCRDLSRPVLLKARTESYSALLVLDLAAADPIAEARIGLDRALAAAERGGAERGNADPAALHRTLADLATRLPADASALLAPDAVLDRAWRLGRYGLAYALRQKADFAYA